MLLVPQAKRRLEICSFHLTLEHDKQPPDFPGDFPGKRVRLDGADARGVNNLHMRLGPGDDYFELIGAGIVDQIDIRPLM